MCPLFFEEVKNQFPLCKNGIQGSEKTLPVQSLLSYLSYGLSNPGTLINKLCLFSLFNTHISYLPFPLQKSVYVCVCPDKSTYSRMFRPGRFRLGQVRAVVMRSGGGGALITWLHRNPVFVVFRGVAVGRSITNFKSVGGRTRNREVVF